MGSSIGHSPGGKKGEISVITPKLSVPQIRGLSVELVTSIAQNYFLFCDVVPCKWLFCTTAILASYKTTKYNFYFFAKEPIICFIV